MVAHTPSCVAFIDAGLPDLHTLQAGLAPDAEIHLLDPTQDGLAQMAAVLADCHGLAALHLITHGAPGKLFIGNAAVDRDMLLNARAEMEAIANAMREDGELLIYGCEVAAGKEGRAFVQALRDTTGLRVAAASHKVGHSELGASWELDDVSSMARQAGAMQYALAIPQWQGVLANTAPTLTSSTPADDATAVAVDGNIVLTFSENVQAGTGNISINTDDSYMGVPITYTRNIAVGDTNQVTISGNTVTINPTVDLNPAKTYYVIMPSGVLTNTAGIPFAGISDPSALNFSTAAPDTTAPVFQSAATSTDGTKVILTYDEAMSPTTAAAGDFAVTVAGNANAVTGVAVSGSTVELTLTTAVTSGQAVTVGYTAPAADPANTNAAIQDTAGNDAASFTEQPVTNNTSYAPVIGGITTEDNSSFAAGTYTYLDSEEDYAFITDDDSENLNGGYLNIAYKSGTENGTFRFTPEWVNEDGTPTGSVAVLASSDGGTTLKTDGSFAAGDSVVVIYAATPILKKVVGVVDDTDDGQAGNPLKINFTTADATTGSSGTGAAGFVLEFLQYTAPTGGARTFEITANDGTNTSTPAEVTLTAKAITYSATTFAEAAANDGSITASITLTLAGDTFTGTNDEALAGASVTNVPDGLTAVVTKTSDTEATVTFTGNATAHANANDIANLTITLGDAAFTGGSADLVANATKSDLVIDFADPAVTAGNQTGYTVIPQPSTLAGGFAAASGLTMDANGKIVIGGFAALSDYSTSDNVISRLNADGSFDTSFGTQGVALIDILDGINDFVTGVLAASDGYFIFGAAGKVTKLTSSGAIDTTWGASGHFDSTYAVLRTAAFDSSGNLYIAGESSATVTKLTIAGAADTSWNTDGVSDAYSATAVSPSKLIVDGSGNIFIAGVNGSSDPDWTLSKLTSTGTVDTSFSTDGTLTYQAGGIDNRSDIAIQPDGKIIMTGISHESTTNHVVRFNADGSLDTTFNGTGYNAVADYATDVHNSDLITNLVLQADGKIVLVGQTAGQDSVNSLLLIRLNSTGEIDTSFGENGYAVTPIANNGLGTPAPVAASIQSDGKILVAGGLNNGSNYFQAVFRFNTDGSLDTTFGDVAASAAPVIDLNGAADGINKTATHFVGSSNQSGFADLLIDNISDSDSTNLKSLSVSIPIAHIKAGDLLNLTFSSAAIAIDGTGAATGTVSSLLITGTFNYAITTNGDDRIITFTPQDSEIAELTSFETLLDRMSFRTTNTDAPISRVFSVSVTDESDNVSPAATFTVTTSNSAITYSATTFAEAAANDGSITASITLTLTGDTFTGNKNGEVLMGAFVTNVPAGLTAVVTKTSNTVATLTLIGKATAHANANDIANLTITLGDAAFTGGSADLVANATKSDLVIDFADPAPPPPAPEPDPEPTPEPTTTTVDGATLTTGTTIINGETVDTLTVSPVPTDREDTGGDAGRADISLFYGDADKSVPATTASLPAGVGLISTGARVPANDAEALATLMALVQQTAGSSESNRPDMISGGNAFLTRLAQQADKGPLIINSVTLTVAPGQTTAPGQPITISGTAERVGQGAGNGGAPVEALVIDTRGLPPGTVLELKNIEFAVIIGDNVIVRGGEGQNIVFAGSGSQNIVLGDDDDELSGGDGDDVIGSRGGNDRLNGDGDNDWLVGGEGDDILNGGTGNDLLHGGISDAGMYRFAVDSAGLLHLDWQATHPDLALAARLGLQGPWKTADGEPVLTDPRFAFTGADMGVLEDVALLYQALIKALPTVADLNTWAASGLSSVELAEGAYQFYTAQQPPGAQALEVQVAQLITQVWGETPDPALVQTRVDYLNQGGSWAETLLYLARHEKNSAAIRTDEGQTRLAQDWVLKETGWSGEGGNDQLFGGEGNDVLVAGSGNNVLDGGSGTDLAVFFGHVDDWQVMLDGAGQIIVSNRYDESQNIIRDIELFQFGGTVLGQIKSDHPVVVTGVQYAITDFLLPATSAQIGLIGVPGYGTDAGLG